MIDSLFYYPMTLHRGTGSASVRAPFVKNLPPVSGVVEEICVRTQDTNPAGAPGYGIYGSTITNGITGSQGVYVWDAIDNRFRFVLPYDVICEGVIAGSYVDIYYALTGTGAEIPVGSTAYRNGALYAGTTFTTNDRAVWAIVTSPAVVAGSVKTVQGISPDSNGNIALPFASETVAGLVRIGANLAIDSNGVLSAQASSSYVLPAATTSTLGGVIVGSGLGVAVDGKLNADVISVNGKQGTVVLAASDITTGTFGAAQLGATPGDNEILITDASGVPTWVSTLPSSNLPSSILGAVDYQGTFVPGTSTLPAAASANKGWYYVASSAGTYTPPGGSMLTFAAGDWIISNGSEWDTVNNQGAVTSVNGQTGAVTIQAVDNNDATGTTLISDNGASTGVVKLKTLVAGTGVTIAPDVNGNLVVASSGVSSFNSRTGDVTLELSDVTGVGGAPTASPALTGVPTAPTATAGTDTDQIATTAFVMSAVDSGVSGVSSFNTRTGAVTLELSDVTGAGGAPLASPAFTGQPTAPTPTSGDDSTNIATTAFVVDAVSAGAAGSIATFEFIAESGQTVFPATFSSGAVVEVFQNGDLLFTTDYTTNGGIGPVTLNTGATLDDEIKILATAPFNVANVVPITGGSYTGVVEGLTAAPGDNSTQFATTAFVTAAMTGSGVMSFNGRTGAVTLMAADVTGVGGALLASPAFTGTPTAPTATAGTNTIQLATSAFVYTATQGSASVALSSTAAVTLTAAQYSVPVVVFTGALTTNVTVTVPTTGEWSFLNLTTGAFTVTISNGTGATVVVAQSTTNYVPLVSNAVEGIVQLSAGSAGVLSFNGRTGAVTLQTSDITGVGGALLASPTFTGTPAAPTATAGNNGTTLATTGFVFNATQATGTVALTNANVTLTAMQYGNAIIDFTGALTGNVVITFPTTGQWTLFNNTTGAFTVTVTNGGGATFAIPQGATIEVISSGATTGMLASSTVSPVRFQSPTYSYSVMALSSSATQTLDLGAASEFTMTITGATTIAFTNTLGAGLAEVVYLRLTNAGSAAITWPASTKFAAGTAPTFTASGTDLVGVKYDTTTSTYMVFVIGLAIA